MCNMKLHFYNLAREPIASRPASDNTKADIKWLFGRFPSPPPDDAITQVAVREDGLEHWAVGPFDLLVKREHTNA
jgi:hypothetical protein